jgi:SAM-dependent methyltransferase
MQLMTGRWTNQAIATVVELGIPDQLRKGAKRSDDIARQAGANADAVYRLLRALASLGLLAETSGRRFTLTPMGRLLTTDAPASMAAYAHLNGHDVTWRPWGQLAYSIRTGQPAFDEVFGSPIFDYLTTHPEPAALFDGAMTSLSAMDARAIVGAYDFRGIGTLMDVAGGHGALLAAILQRHKKMRGILFDLPHVVAGATATFTKASLTGRVTVTSGDFFKELPGGADAIIMKHIIHDWDDESATRILQACRRALGPKGKLLIVDTVIPPGNAFHFGKLLDLEMLVLSTRGRERTKQEFAHLLAGAGFRLKRIVPTPGPKSIVEAVPV